MRALRRTALIGSEDFRPSARLTVYRGLVTPLLLLLHKSAFAEAEPRVV